MMKKDEELVTTTNTFSLGSPDSLVVVVPKEIRDRLGINGKTHFKVLLDKRGRIIYERIV